jgi:predicted nucleic acid-binding protein
MKIIVNDANILIDLISIDLLDNFLNLDFEFHTNDLILNEIDDPEQKRTLEEVIKAQKLFIHGTKAEDYSQIISLMSKNLSFEDCSIWFYTKKVEGILLTGDAKLRKMVEQDNIEVRGILFVFDLLVEKNILERHIAVDKLNQLSTINSRLPQKEINKRLTLWKSE